MDGKLILITGGARSGKSSFAVQLATKLGGEVAYVATAEIRDSEMAARISRHRNSRPSYWKTIEAADDLERVLLEPGEADVLLVDCLTLFVNNLLSKVMDNRLWDDTKETWESDEIEEVETRIIDIFDRMLAAIPKDKHTVIMVTNELGLGVVPPYPSGRFYRDLMGTVNQQVASAADEVYFMISGVPMKMKG